LNSTLTTGGAVEAGRERDEEDHRRLLVLRDEGSLRRRSRGAVLPTMRHVAVRVSADRERQDRRIVNSRIESS
jgi:hypothetical protein